MSFESDLAAFAKSTDARANAVVRKIVLEVYGSLIFKSPVGNPNNWSFGTREALEGLGWVPKGYVGGRFRGNWQIGIGTVNTKVDDTVRNNGALGDYNSAAASNDGLSKVPFEAGGKIYFLTNSLIYGPRLEEGYSRQAPNGMVALTTLEFTPIVENATRELAK